MGSTFPTLSWPHRVQVQNAAEAGIQAAVRSLGILKLGADFDG